MTTERQYPAPAPCFPRGTRTLSAALFVALAIFCATSATAGLLDSRKSSPPSVDSRINSPSFGTTIKADDPSFVGEIQLHGGAFMPANATQVSSSFGGRASALLTNQLSAGLSVDWFVHSHNSLGSPASALPASEYTPKPVLADASTQLLPVMLFAQIAPWPKAPLIPYAGIGGGYEWLRSTAHDYQAGTSYEATFSNWAWQMWGGMGLKLARQLRLDGEAYYNGGTLKREASDPNGSPYRQVVTIDGTGARFGLNLVY